MSIILIWLSSIIITKGMKLITGLKIFKDIGNEGYKFKYDSISEFKVDEYNKYFDLIPFYNILNIMMISSQYINNKDFTLSQFCNLDLLEEMNDEEKKIFQKRPNGMTVIYLTALSKIKEEIERENEKESNENRTINFVVEYNDMTVKAKCKEIKTEFSKRWNFDKSDFIISEDIRDELKSVIYVTTLKHILDYINKHNIYKEIKKMLNPNPEIKIKVDDNLLSAILKMQKALDEQDRLKSQNNIDISSQSITSTIPSHNDEDPNSNVEQSINENKNREEETTLKLTQKNTHKK